MPANTSEMMVSRAGLVTDTKTKTAITLGFLTAENVQQEHLGMLRWTNSVHGWAA